MRWLVAFLLSLSLAHSADQETQWDAVTAGGAGFYLPAHWTKRVIEPKPAEDGTIFRVEAQRRVWLRVRILPRTGEVPKPRPATRDVLSEPAWKDLADSVEAAGYALVKGGAARSRMLSGVLQEELVIDTKHDGVSKGFRLAVLTLPEKVIRVELIYTRSLSHRMFGDVMEIWGSVKFDRASSAGTDVAVLGAPSGSSTGAGTPSLPAGTPAVSPALVPSAGRRSIADLVRDYRDSLVFIEGGSGSGSGFICKTPEGTFLYTNLHVVAGMPRISCTRMDGAAVKIGAASAAVGHDEMRFAVDAQPMPFESAAQVENVARIGDEVVVLGNAEGSRVISPRPGKLVGIGPDRIEVDAQFVPGNSGSPIVHVPTGKVIGIATYLTKERYTELTNRKEPAIRRFGYRLDSVKQWQPVNWAAFQGERAEIEKISALTRDFARLLEDVASDSRLDPALHRNSGLARIVADLDRAFGRQAASAADRQRVLQHFLLSLRSATRSDITAASSRLRYDFFVQQLKEEGAIREEFHKIFDKSANSLR